MYLYRKTGFSCGCVVGPTVYVLNGVSFHCQVVDELLQFCGQAKRTGKLFDSTNPLNPRKFFKGLKVGCNPNIHETGTLSPSEISQ